MNLLPSFNKEKKTILLSSALVNHIHKNQIIGIIIQLVVLSECLKSSFVFFFVVELPDLAATFSW